MDILESLFDSPARAKLLKLFLMNPDAAFTGSDASRQAQIKSAQFASEARRLAKLRMLKSWETKVATSGKKSRRRRRVRMFAINKEFPFFIELRNLMLKSAPHAKGPLSAKIKRLGNIKLAVLAGVFVDSPTSRVDLLLVGDGFKKARMKSFIQWLEARVGKEMNYVAMSLSEFKYRMDMYDRFVRDILEFPHETVVNKLGI